MRIFTVHYIILFSEYSIFLIFFICGGCLSCPLTTLDGFPSRSLLFYLFNVMAGFCTMWIWHELRHTRSIQKQELGSCWDGRPFGHNRHGLINGGLLCPFPWGAGSPSNIMWPGPRSTSVPKWHLDPSSCLTTIHQRYRQTGKTDNGPIAWGVPLLVTVAQKSQE